MLGKPQVKFEGGKLVVELSGSHDGNADGEASVEAKVELKLDAVELIQEIAKVDLPWLNSLVAGLAK